jgi:hypothetical protein
LTASPKEQNCHILVKVIKLRHGSCFERVYLTTEVSLERVYEEVKRMRLELKTIEKSLDSLLESLIPEGEELSPEEIKELDALSKEVDEGECVPLNQVLEKYEAPERGKVQSKRSQKN